MTGSDQFRQSSLSSRYAHRRVFHTPAGLSGHIGMSPPANPAREGEVHLRARPYSTYVRSIGS